MIALKNFILVWWHIFVAVLVSSFALVFIYPLAFIFANHKFTTSTEFEVEVVKKSFRKLEKAIVNIVQQHWSEK
jgi:hypothetical protein